MTSSISLVVQTNETRDRESPSNDRIIAQSVHIKQFRKILLKEKGWTF